MPEWLKQQLKNPNPWVRIIALFVITFSSFMGFVTVISDTGFSQEIQNNRALVWAVALAMALFVAVGWSYWRQHRELTDSRTLVNQLQDEISNLEKQRDRFGEERDSALKLMQSYKAEVQEDTINTLQRLALLAIKQEQWREKEAKVERLRVEEAMPVDDESMDFGFEERIIVLINLGTEDDVMEHMRFSVQDPTDMHEYGIVEILEVHRNGARCGIVEVLDSAFWNDVRQAAQEGRSCVLDAPTNVIVPVSALKEIPPESAQQLLTWLRNIRRVEL